MRKRIIFVCLVLVLFIFGCSNLSKNPCQDCRIKCPGADRTACVDDNKCECYYNEKENNSESYQGNNSENKSYNNNQENNQSHFNKEPMSIFEIMPSCEERMDFFDVSPVKFEEYMSIIPLGNLNPPRHVFPTDHIYVLLKKSYENKKLGTEVPLYIPGDVWITDIGVQEEESSSENTPLEEYDIVFYPCKELSFRLAGIVSLSGEILSKFNSNKKCEEIKAGAGNINYRYCTAKDLNIKVNSGQEIGATWGFDLFATDSRITELKSANPDRWYNYSRNLKYTVCPLDYFIEPEKTKLYSLLGGWDNIKRTIEPLCGTVEQDIKGTAQGNWFVKGIIKTMPEFPHLALALDNGNPGINVFSVGTSIPNLDSKRYLFSPKSEGEINIAFSKVKPGAIYCYEQAEWDFTIVLELLNETTLKIEKQPGNKCDEPFKLNSGVLFER